MGWRLAGGRSDAEAEALSAAEVQDPAVREALQAERSAEAMASEATMTWRRAQQATAAVRNDRGFWVTRLAKGSDQCHKCGSFGHFARDCPKGGKLGKGKMGYVMDYDYEMDDGGQNAFCVGKGKKKGKSKMSFAIGKGPAWNQKGKNKSRLMPGGVNAYGMEMLGTEGSTLLDFKASQEADSLSPQSGLLDCGATASAGPEASVQRLVAAVLERDSKAQITIDQQRRPYFRYGSGSWGGLSTTSP